MYGFETYKSTITGFANEIKKYSGITKEHRMIGSFYLIEIECLLVFLRTKKIY